MKLDVYSLLLLVISLSQLQVGGQRTAGCVRPKIENGRAKVRARGKMVYYRCKKKFIRVGAKFSVCLPKGVWSQPPPICIGKGCPSIIPTNTLQILGEHNGAMLKFTCPAGMKREGPESIYCNGKKWNAEQPTCVVGISLQCDFEEEELCGWSQSDNDDFEWTWFSGNTPTVNTGPLRDHTFGINSTGHYLFIESSSPRKPMDKAVLASPLYQAIYSDICFEFWYHMQGPDEENAVGSLKVFIKPESQALDHLDPKFVMEGNQGEDWKQGNIYIEDQTEVFQIVIMGTRKEAFVSDIAIDDVRMYNCSSDAIIESTPNIFSLSVPMVTTDSSMIQTTEISSDSMSTSETDSKKSTVSNLVPSKIGTKRLPTTKRTLLLSTTSTASVTSMGKTTKPITKTNGTTMSDVKSKKSTATNSVPTKIGTKTQPTSNRMPLLSTKSAASVTSMQMKTKQIKKTTMGDYAKSERSTVSNSVSTKIGTKRLFTTKSTPLISTKSTASVTSMRKTTKRIAKATRTTVSDYVKSKKATVSTSVPTKIGTKRQLTTKRIPLLSTKSAASETSMRTTKRIAKTNRTFIGDYTTPAKKIRYPAITTQMVSTPTTWKPSTRRTLTNVTTTSAIGHESKNRTPLIVGISCGIGVGLIVIAILTYLWARRNKNKSADDSEEEMAPITSAEGGYYHPG